MLYERSCFALTDAGLTLARSVPDTPRFLTSTTGKASEADLPPRPHWNAEARELSVDGQLVKRFKSPAQNQETVLCVFEEEGWPSRIDDPLSGGNGHRQDSKRRLNDTVKGLNQYHATDLIRFASDGTGEDVRWDCVGGASSNADE